jgi:hypothetical protein
MIYQLVYVVTRGNVMINQKEISEEVVQDE